MPGYSALPPNTSAKPSLSTSSASKPSIAATSGDLANSVGAPRASASPATRRHFTHARAGLWVTRQGIQQAIVETGAVVIHGVEDGGDGRRPHCRSAPADVHRGPRRAGRRRSPMRLRKPRSAAVVEATAARGRSLDRKAHLDVGCAEPITREPGLSARRRSIQSRCRRRCGPMKPRSALSATLRDRAGEERHRRVADAAHHQGQQQRRHR